MKYLLNFTLVLCSVAAACGGTTLPWYESFPNSYAEGERLGTAASAAIWDTGNSTGTGSPTNTTAAKLTGAGLVTTADSRGILLLGTPGSNRDRGAIFNPAAAIDVANPTIYASFLLNVQAAPSATRRVAYLRNSTSAGTPSAGVFLNQANQLQVSKSSTAPDTATTSALTAGTHLVVLRYRWVSETSGDDEVALWLDPGSLGVAEGSEPTPTITTTNGGDVSTMNAFFISHLTTASGTLWLDEVRVATTWAGATPSDGSVVNPPSTPIITQALRVAEGLVLRGTNGPGNAAYSVLATADPAVPTAQWPAISTNTFDAAGNFDVTNAVAGNVPVQFYRLKVAATTPPGPTAPTIVTQPTNRTVVVGQNAQFAVGAGGTTPLSYQWYYNTHTVLTGATSNSLTVVNSQLANAGTYHVVVTNSVGSITSALATLAVNTPPPAGSPDGYATINGGTTGGAGGPTVTVNNLTDLEFYAGLSTPYTILIDGTINLGSSNVRVRNNKSIIGLGTNAMLVGDLKVFGNNNVIIRNITFTNPSGAGDSDGLTLQDCLNVWVDHCTFVDCDDGSLDITHGADWITVSWCHFYYTNPANTHRFSNLVGHSDSSTAEAEDAGKLHITFHHNWWGQLVHERMPRVRFGRVHVYNNYYNSTNNNNCIRAARDSEVLVENNYFQNVKNVWELYRTTGLDGKVFAANNIEVNTTWAAGGDSNSIQIPGTDPLGTDANGLNPPPYAYTLEAAATIPAAVTAGAGVGKGPFAP